MDSEGFEIFDWATWAAIVRAKRRKLGYKAAEEFARRIWLETRVKLTREIIYKIEGGKQQPSAEQFWAINLVLFGKLMPGEEIFSLCLADEWGALVDSVERGEHKIPDKWRRENTEFITREYLQTHKSLPQLEWSDMTYTALISAEAASFSNSPRSLFEALPGENWTGESPSEDKPPSPSADECPF